MSTYEDTTGIREEKTKGIVETEVERWVRRVRVKDDKIKKGKDNSESEN